MKGHPISYSAAELAFVELRQCMTRRLLHAEFVRAFGRTDVTLGALTALCKRKGWLTGRTGQFVPGQVPANKGKPMPYNANSARTQFKKGQRPHNTNYAGHERVSKDGYVEISVEKTNPHTGFERRYVLKHRWLWEQKHGPLPDGMCLKCLGDRLDTDPANWALVPRAMLPRLNGRFGRDYDSAPAVLKPIIMTVAQLEHRAREARREERG
ncbi:MAG: HNH endonuclease signature motif containing protein [Aliihoeflea sp.]|uniref:HNH endonuclease signature motif containing protein n=1 Tax=Aliihoeflea sp. TaxID=2608088 RepID=UPI004034C573